MFSCKFSGYNAVANIACQVFRALCAAQGFCKNIGKVRCAFCRGEYRFDKKPALLCLLLVKYFFIDGHNLSFRSFYALPDLRNKDSFPTGALHAFSAAIFGFASMHCPHNTAIFFDKGRSKRHTEIRSEYKANRSSMPDDMRLQMPYIKEICAAMGFAVVEHEGIEGDDLLGSAVQKVKDDAEEIYILSSDKDFAQLVAPKVYQLLPPVKSADGWRQLDIVAVRAKFGVSPAEMVDYLSLMGDNADNIEGLAGVGPKTAAKWIKDFGSVENIIKRADWIKPEKFRAQIAEKADLLRANTQLIRLKCDYDIGSLENSKPDFEKLVQIFEKMALKRSMELLKRYAWEDWQVRL